MSRPSTPKDEQGEPASPDRPANVKSDSDQSASDPPKQTKPGQEDSERGAPDLPDLPDETIAFKTTDQANDDATRVTETEDEAEDEVEDGLTIVSAPEVLATIDTDEDPPDANTVVGQSELPSFGDRLGTSDKAKLSSEIKKFEMIDELGSGGFGTVIRARDKLLDREVAIKIIKSASLANDARMIKNFKAEARAAASLRHPNIVPVHQSGDDGNDQMFIVFDYIPGHTLRDLVRRKKKLSLRKIVQLMAKVADALGYAHSKGIVHRDVKPANILIARTDNEPHIADFGCARRRQYESPSTSESKLKHYVGTAPYFSPEQASGHSHQADARTDVWAMGVILDEMITGRRTFRDGEKSKDALFKSIQNDEPVPLRERSSDVDRDLNAIWKCCLEKDANDRYPTGRELAEDLEAWLRGDAVSVRPLGVWEGTTRWAKRNPQVAGLILAVLTSLTAGLFVSWWFYRGEVAAQKAQIAAQIERLETANPDGVDEILRAIHQDNLRKYTAEGLLERWNRRGRGSEESAADRRVALAIHHTLAEKENSSKMRKHVEVSLLRSVKSTSPRELKMMFIQQRLRLGQESVVELQRTFNDEQSGSGERLRSVCALLANQDMTITEESGGITVADGGIIEFSVDPKRIVDWLIKEVSDTGNLDMSDWVLLLNPVRNYLLGPLEERLDDQGQSKRIASAILSDFYANDTDYLRKRILTEDDDTVSESLLRLKLQLRRAGSRSVSPFLEKLIGEMANPSIDDQRRARDTARYWITAMYVAHESQLASVKLQAPPGDPTALTIFEQRAAEYGLPADRLLLCIRQKKELGELEELGDTNLQHLLRALINYDPPAGSREEDSKLLFDIVHHHPDGGVHAACLSLIRRWGLEEPTAAELPTDYSPERNWRVSGDTRFVRLLATDAFQLGSPDSEIERYSSVKERGHDDSENAQSIRLACEFEMAITEVTTATFREYLVAHYDSLTERYEKLTDEDAMDVLDIAISRLLTLDSSIAQIKGRDTDASRDLSVDDLPKTNVSWYDAVSYCVWRSNAEGLPSCYGTQDEVIEASQTATSLPIDFSKNGYRLPTLAEWEYACRCRSTTPWNFGSDPRFIAKYAACQRNSTDAPSVVASFLPNRFGLFDMLGNVQEWTSSNPGAYESAGIQLEPVTLPANHDKLAREVRGGSFAMDAPDLRSAARANRIMTDGTYDIGFRIVRTLRVLNGTGPTTQPPE